MTAKPKPKRKAKSRAKPGAVMGRPTKYKPEYCAEVISLMAQGLCRAEVCARWGIARQTLLNWAEEHAEFLDAYKKGEEALHAWFCELFKRCTAAPTVSGPNVTAAIWLSKNVAGFKDKVEASIEHSGSVDHKHEVAMAGLSTEQLKAMQAIMLKGDNKEG